MRKRLPRAVPSYPPEVLAALLDVLDRTSSVVGRTVLERDDLETELLSLLFATGLAHDGSEAGKLWLEVPPTSARRLMVGYRAMTKTSNPLDPKVCKSDLWPNLNALIYARWGPRRKREGRYRGPSLKTLRWEERSKDEREEVRFMVRHLADHFRRKVPGRGGPQKTDFDTALEELATIFLRYTGQQCEAQKIPGWLEAHFFKFATLALKPGAPEVTLGAISVRCVGSS